MAFSLDRYWTNWREEFETILERLIPVKDPVIFFEAMRYASLQGGKRLRPLLAVAASDGLGASQPFLRKAASAGCAIEIIHAHSLVHDDLPCLDNDLLRRGKPTVHAAYGESLALLAGDGLLSHAFCALLEELGDLEPSLLLRLVGELSHATFDMVRGQVSDLLSEGKDIGAEDLSFIHRNKTGALINAAVRFGALIGGADSLRLEQATAYARALGLAFQIVDDILDETATAAELGKTPGKDRDKGKATYVKLYGLEESRKEAGRQVETALWAIEDWPNPEPLRAIARFVAKRNH